MMSSRPFTFSPAALGLAVCAMFSFSTASLAGGSLKDAPVAEKPRCTFSPNVGVTTDYVFRGYSQSAEGAAIQGGVDATCGIFYAGMWASSINWNAASSNFNNSSVEMDWYLGIKPVTGRVTWDFGLIYYTYPNGRRYAPSFGGKGTNEYLELKAGASTEVWKDGTLTGTIFYSPDYQYGTGNVWTFEGGLAQGLPKIGPFTPTVSALLGYQTSSADSYKLAFGNGDTNYLYWNAGVTFGFAEKWSLDLRYWDTNLSDKSGGSGWCKGDIFQCNDRYVATLKFTY